MKSSLKTYSHLAGERRLPSEYEIVTSRLHYYTEKGFEVAVPLADWYARYQKGSPLTCSDWERFRDPRETTYTKYTGLQTAKEAHVDGILRSIEESGYDAALPSAWVDGLETFVTPLRYVFHALQMTAAYVGQMAPSGRITIAASFQAADEMRRIQRIAYRMGQLRRLRPEFGARSRAVWQEAPAWQPLRRCLETLLVAYDWGEAVTALNIAVKPVVDEFFMVELPLLAKARGDYLLGEIFRSLHEDCRWQRDWTKALVEVALADAPSNRAVLREWAARWRAAAGQGIAAVAEALGDGADAAVSAASERTGTLLESWGLE